MPDQHSDQEFVYHDEAVDDTSVSLDVAAVDAIPVVYALYNDDIPAGDGMCGDVTHWVVALPDGRAIIMPRSGRNDIVFADGLARVAQWWAPLRNARLVSVVAEQRIAA